MKKISLFALVGICNICCLSSQTLNKTSTIKSSIINLQPSTKEWFPYFDFDVTKFQAAPREFGPFSRWWLPGNDITSEELQREIKMFADNGFAGVEVQPLTMGLNPKAPQEQHDRIYSWDTPSFYEHLAAIMEQGKISNVVVDMNGGSGWPLGGSFFDLSESMKTLSISDTILKGGETFSGTLPKPHNHDTKPAGYMGASLQNTDIDLKYANIQSIIAAKILKKLNNQTVLDPKSIMNLMTNSGIYAGENKINWKAPTDGEWAIVTAWTIPTGEEPSLVASPKKSLVVDHLNPKAVNQAYDHMLGERSGLPKYYGKPLRAIFNDSYEFHTDRMISSDFLKVFQEKNGYDIAPYLGSVFQKGYNHPVYLAEAYPHAKPPFSFSETENWRMMYDYDVTVNEVFKNNFIKTSDAWMEKNGLLHRTQAYGFPNDLIGCAGAANIPEAEQLFAEGSEGYLKLITSGAHLYHRPVITQESFVSIYRAEMTTPQKIKMWADKSFACGINQLIYHGTPYKYNNGEYGKEGWNTWSGPYAPYINFSTGMNESDHFWKDIKTVNQYLARCQYALRSGKPKTDVLIYMPFIDFSEDQMSLNPEEILYRGFFKEIEPDIKGFGVFEAPKTPANIWYSKLWTIVNDLESKGISWEFVNDEALQKAKNISGNIDIEGSNYQKLILANLPYINLKTAQHINALSKQGLNIITVGDLPQKQPSFLNWEANDLVVKNLMAEISNQKGTIKITGNFPTNIISQKIKFIGNTDFSRQITREMSDGSEIKFLWNKSDKWQTITLDLAKSFSNSYFMDAENGKIIKNSATSISYQLSPRGSVILFATKGAKVLNNIESGQSFTSLQNSTEISKIDSWNIKAGDIVLNNSPLFDWRTNEKLKYNSDESIYSSTFNLKNKATGQKYFIDLGEVYYTADITINGQNAGKRLFAPYQLDITQFVKKGGNTVEIKITTTRRNGFIGEALKKNPFYAQFNGKEKEIVPSGLVGPVSIKMTAIKK